MAKKRRGSRRRSRNFVAIPFEQGVTVGALAQNAVEATAILTFGEDIYLVSADVTVIGRSGTAGEGPLPCGMAHGDLTDSEIEEAVSAEVTDPDDIIAAERARRPVRKIGSLEDAAGQQLENGSKIRLPLRFSVGDGHTLKLWVRNASAASPLTSGAVVQFSGTLYGRWQR